MGTWSGGTQSIPVTKPGEVLAVLDVADPTHPKLVRAVVVNNLAEEATDSTEVLEDHALDGEEKESNGKA